MQEAYTEDLVQLAIQSLDTKQTQSAKRVAASHNVPRTNAEHKGREQTRAGNANLPNSYLPPSTHYGTTESRPNQSK